MSNLAAQIAQTVFILGASVGVYSFVRAAQADQRFNSCQAWCQMRPNYAGRNRSVPDFQLKNMQGQMRRMSDFTGKGPVVLNFWTKTCQPCLEEMPELADMARILKKDGVTVVTVCTDEGPEAVRDTLQVVLEGQEPPFEVLFDPDGELVVEPKFGTALFPETWLIDKAGIIRARIDGNPGQRGMGWTSSIPLEVLENMQKPGSCPVDFLGGNPSGKHASLCGEDL